MKKSKYRIYTIAPPKNILCIFVAAVMAVVLLIAGALCTKIPDKAMFEFFAKKSIDTVLFSDKNHKKLLKLPDIKIHTILNQLSPVFGNSEKSVFIYGSNKNKDAKKGSALANDTAKKPESGLNTVPTPDIKNETSYAIDADYLCSLTRTYNATGSKPKVLIVHTHACETYSTGDGTGLGNGGEYRTTDTSKNMIKIGEEIAKVFKENGINALHDKTLCDYPQYNTSYVKSLEVIENYLLKYPSIEFVFDIHRDAIAQSDGTPIKLSCKINGEETARAMIVCGTDAMGLENPNWQENLILALKIQKNLDKAYPGFMRPVNLRKERFNMHKTKGSLLFEIGTHGNTIEEAIRAARYLAEGVAKTIK